MTANELISVIIPAYNAEKYIGRCIESVINQTYTNLDIVIVNDGSADRTGEIAERYAEKDKRIQCYTIFDKGTAPPKNYGVKCAKGSLIAFCDSDDIMHSDMIEKMYAALKKFKADTAVCSFYYVNENGKALNWKAPEFKFECLDAIEAEKQFLTTYNIEGFAWNKLVKKALYTQHGIRYDESKAAYVDIVASYNLIRNSDKIAFVNESLYDYFQINTSCVHTISIAKICNFEEVLNEVTDLSREHGLEKEGRFFKRYRLYDYLFNIFKNRKSYSQETIKRIRGIYKKNLSLSIADKVKLVKTKQNCSILKAMLKIIIVDLYFM